MTTSSRARTIGCVLLAGTIYAGLAAPPARAQAAPAFRQLDPNGVDVVKGDFLASFAEGSIGSGEAELALLRMVGATGTNGSPGFSQFDHMLLSVGASGTYVDFGPRADKFPGAEARGATLSGGGDSYAYAAPDGSVVAFGDPSGNPAGGSTNFCDTSGTQASCVLLPTSIASPDGKTVILDYEFWRFCIRSTDPDVPVNCNYTPRLSRISNSYGYSIAFAYASAAGSSFTSNPPATFRQRTGAAFYNNAAGSAALAAVSYAYPSAGVTDVTDTGGRVWRVTSGTGYYGLRRPGAASDTLGATLSGGIVASAVNAGSTTTYSRSLSGTTATMTVTDALGQATTIVSDVNVGRPSSITDPLSRTTAYQYDSSGRLTRATAPEGNYTDYAYDSRGNVTQVSAVAKPGSGLPPIVTSASYDGTCANALTCNQPNSITDARGNVTDYSYSAAHGGVLAVTAPAPAPGAPRPQTRYAYTLVSGEYRLTGTSQCQTGSSCAGTADEAVTSLAYDASGNLVSTSSGNGAGTLSAAGAMTYDAVGNLLTVDGPLAGAADTVRYRYDSARELVGTVSPDPDGGGALKPRAVRNGYTNGLLTKVEQGVVDSQSDSDWAAFTSLQEVDTAYDSNARPVTRSLVAGGATYALTQTSYDSLGRVECVARRMNPSAFGALPSSACTLGTSGSYGPDRIAKTFRDAAGQVTKTTVALGVAGVEVDEATSSYTANGLVQTVTDAENNRTTYVYDGHDRLSQTQYPSATKGAGTSNASDYEQLTYETTAGGTRTSATVAGLRNRAGETIGFATDALGRVIAKDLPGSEPDVTYGYDLLGRMTAASQTGNSLAFTYDALGRNLTQAGPQGTLTSAWDLAGRRTRITHPDGFYVDEEHLVTGETSVLRENGATSGAGVLATYSYDTLGRRSSLTRGDGSVQSYGYDAVSRLTGLADNLAGTAYDQSLGFGYTPASQIASNTRSNDAYAWTGHYNVSRGYTANGRNQYTATGSVTPTYDSKGNLTSAGSTTYSYSSENLLTSATGGIALAYDPALRLYQTSGGTAGTTRFAYDGADLVAEYNGSNAMLRRYVHGPGTDEPLVWYEGSGTSDRRFLHADERGSIVAVTNSAGTTLNVNAYDEYGIPSSGNAGRFQYTGQTWLAELGMYYYKARIYSPTLGRFLQPDPIGFNGGMNLYGYAGGDPVNASDPAGLAPKEPSVTCTGSRIAGACGAYGGIASGLSGFSSAGPAGRDGPTVGDAYDAARNLVGGYGGTAMQSVVNYLLGTGGLGQVAANLPVPPRPGGFAFADDGNFLLAGANSPAGRIYGDRYTGTNRYRGALTDRSGGYLRAAIDIDELAVLNGALPLGLKNGISAPPAGWQRIDPRGGGVIFRHLTSGIQLRITGGQVHIDFPAGTRIGTGAFDVSEWGEVVHYD
ncbi:MAG: RHS repeat-associated core domain-containing protein [Alphaproteobacteria bacterium]|nr:RHS repeat-associated core domain-containing protein [Alphaproteobacteria bacterium]MBV9372861.1 RHS repeat-associated core domain-containing protein [Alphaproteobacteria bacterium]MBV9902049.1 RHS repeat-associated core domain-containing protein [Alphaproteobacteria bacterium]